MHPMQKSANFVGKKIDDFILTNQLGAGAFGTVFEASNISTKKIVAIKSVPKSKLKEHNGLVGELIQTEVQVLLQCNNENVVKMIKYLESENNCYMVMEYCNQGDFEQLWKKRNRIIPEKEAVAYLKQILNGMKGLHELNVIHRDLKLANILIDNGMLKIGDLGFAKRLDNKDQTTNTALGTLGTMAPEVIEFKPYGLLADMFSLGAIYYQMLFGQLPFSIKNYDDFLKDIKQNKPNFNRAGIAVSKESQDIMTQMLQPDPRYRMKWNAIYDHPLFQDGKRGIAGLNQMTISQMAAGQVDMTSNNKLYKQNQAKLDQITDANMVDRIKQSQQGQRRPHIQIVKEEEKTADLERTINEQNSIKSKEKDINETIDRYLGLRNCLVYLARLLDEMHKHQHSEFTNVYLPAFLIVKKLLIENNELITHIKQNKNIFNCKNIVELYNNRIFVSFFKTLEGDALVISDHFNIILAQCKDIFSKMANPNIQILNELQAFPTQYFTLNYKDALVNYYFQLDEEKKHQNETIKNRLTNLSIWILDALAYDSKFKQELSKPQFDVDNYFNQLDFQTDKEKEKQIEEKFTILF